MRSGEIVFFSRVPPTRTSLAISLGQLPKKKKIKNETLSLVAYPDRSGLRHHFLGYGLEPPRPGNNPPLETQLNMRDLKIVTGTANVELAKLIASCNQVPLVRALTSGRLIRLTCAPLLGEAIRRIHNEESMQGLFRPV